MCFSSSVFTGADSQSLLCSESMLQTSEDAPRYRHEPDVPAWKHDAHGLKSSLKYGSFLHQNHKEKLRTANLLPKDLRNRDSRVNSNCVQHHGGSSGGRRECDGGGGVGGRMTTNGEGRSAMTGSSTTTSENLPWLADVVPCQAQSARTTATILTSSISGSSSHDPHLMLPAVSGSLFRPPLSDPTQRLYQPQQYAPIYTTTTSSPLYSGSLYSGQSSQLASLSAAYGAAFYPQYPHGYTASGSSAALLASHYPHIDPTQSYSAVLASMGSHVQHASQTQLPRSPFLPGHLPHGAAYSLTPTSSPGPIVPRSLTPQGPLGHDPHRRDTRSPKLDLGRQPRSSSPGPRDITKGREHSSPPHGHHAKVGHSILKDSHPQDKDTGYKVPHGKEGSRKHRYLSRPTGLEFQGSFIEPHRPMGPPHYPSHHKPDEPTAKRQKGNIGHPPPLHPSHTSSGGASAPPRHPGQYPIPHYPPHFMKGSIIQLANGELRRVEELRTDDFVNSADISNDLKIDSSTVVRIEINQERGTALLGFSVGQHRVQVRLVVL